MNRKNTNIVIILVIVVIVIFLGLGFLGIGGFNFLAQGQPQQDTAAPATLGGAQALLDEVQKVGSVSELKGADIVVGTGDVFVPGDTIEVSYTGVLPNGTVFDSTDAHGGVPLTLLVKEDGSLVLKENGGGLIQGWSMGMAGMKEGGRRLLAIPPSLGYGTNAVGQIPANSTLIFEVVLVKRTPGAGTSAGTP